MLCGVNLKLVFVLTLPLRSLREVTTSSSAFVDNMIFAFFFGMCSYLAVSKTVKTAVGLGFAVIFVLTVTIPINYLIENFVLKEGALTWMGDEYASVNLNYLTFIMFIAVIASTVQLVEMIVEKISPALYGALGIFLPLIAVNCAILGGALFMQEKQFANIGQATVYGLGSGVGWFIAVVLIAAIRERIRYAHIPGPLRGVGMAFLITGLMGLAFLGFMGFEI